jgi:DNA polymerase
LDVLQKHFYGNSSAYTSFAEKKDACKVFSHYQKVVQSEGNVENPTFMFVGEAPGADEVEQGRPFVGMAGERLRKELRKFPDIFNKSTTLITNIIPCRPLKNQFPDNVEIVYGCMDRWLSPEIALTKPKVLVTLGNVPLKNLVGLEGITNNRGWWRTLNWKSHNMLCFSTFHPSYVIRLERMKDAEKVKMFENDIAQIADQYKSKMVEFGVV